MGDFIPKEEARKALEVICSGAIKPSLTGHKYSIPISRSCRASFEFEGNVNQEAISGLVKVLENMKEHFPENAEDHLTASRVTEIILEAIETKAKTDSHQDTP